MLFWEGYVLVLSILDAFVHGVLCCAVLGMLFRVMLCDGHLCCRAVWSLMNA